MKKIMRIYALGAVLLFSQVGIAQSVNTLYFLENAPMRHTINPAFQPKCEFYLPLPGVGNLNFYGGNNAIMMQDIFYKDPATGQLSNALQTNLQGDWYNTVPDFLHIGTDIQFNLISFGWRLEDYGYIHVNSTERIELGLMTPKSLLGIAQFGTTGTLGLNNLGVKATAYADLSLGYSHRINNQWTVGAKLKILFGHAYINSHFDEMGIKEQQNNANIHGKGNAVMAGLFNTPLISGEIQKEAFLANMWQYLIPSGYGLGMDLGFTYKPHKQVSISAAVTDLGFMRWGKTEYANICLDTTLTGLNTNNNHIQDGTFHTDSLLSGFGTSMMDIAKSLQVTNIENKSTHHMINAKLNIGVDANFWKNRVGVGVYSQTKFFHNYITEEVTLGAAFRPYHWVSLAASYSFLNGHWSNMGAAISIAPYDGIMFTFAADYIPLSYANASIKNKAISLPYKADQLNFSIGIAIVTGVNRKPLVYDRDKDRVVDFIDECLNTPLGVEVDSVGCPLDTDMDGVPDYKDECPNTPAIARNHVDEKGCMLDTDEDGVYDYMDQCPNTPFAARNYVDSVGCTLDTDGDGVADYEDLCPTTPGVKANLGCPTVTREVRKLLKKAMHGIQFEHDKSTIKPNSYAMLDQIAQTFIDNPSYRVEIQGHTNNIGTHEYNMGLSERRAIAVRDYLIDKGVPASMLTIQGYGPDMPIGDNKTRQGKIINRRVEFRITFEEVTYEIINDKVQDKNVNK